jgi:hypothetical protein
MIWMNPGKAVALVGDDPIKDLAKKDLLTLKRTKTVVNCAIIKVLARSMGAAVRVLEIINTVLVAEQLAVTCYYPSLSASAILHDRRVAGSSGDPDAVAPDGDAVNVAYLQAALDQEQKHPSLVPQGRPDHCSSPAPPSAAADGLVRSTNTSVLDAIA